MKPLRYLLASVLIIFNIPLSADPEDTLGLWQLSTDPATGLVGELSIFRVYETDHPDIEQRFQGSIIWCDSNIVRLVLGDITLDAEVTMTELPVGDPAVPFFHYRGDRVSTTFWSGPSPHGLVVDKDSVGGFSADKLNPGQNACN